MFVVTFYSFKGGVGRTMALVNCAVQFARRGMRTLIVDFDLEAPGISAYREFADAKDARGIVDYVTEYLDTSSAPAVSKFITKCVIDESKLTLWVMSAGRRDATYAMNLGRIDWQALYERRSGYLLFEDLRQQWESYRAHFDYVLIDSRTGHTDVGGICTRQLAQADVLMFVPNAQNILGLKDVVADIRSDTTERASHRQLLFCPSNVPDLDDEDGILARRLEIAEEELGYAELATVIHHYNSLALIDEAIFVRDRPNTKLSTEYRQLHDAIAALNDDDIEGARKFVHSLRAQFLLRPWMRGASEFVASSLDRMERISRVHGHDGELAWEMSFVYQIFGKLSGELEALTASIEAGSHVVDARLRRARNLTSQSRPDEAKEDLLLILRSQETTGVQLASALELMRTIGANWADLTEMVASRSSLSSADASVVAEALMRDKRTMGLAYDVLRRALEREPAGSTTDSLDNNLVLALIGAGRFDDALKFFGKTEDQMMLSTEVNDIFNYAMAAWGKYGEPSLRLIGRALELGRVGRRLRGDANYSQCMSLCEAITGNEDTALELLSDARSKLGAGTIFSCWSYMTVDRRGMLKELDEMEGAIRGRQVVPRFIAGRQLELLH